MQPGHHTAAEMRAVCSQEHRVASENQRAKEISEARSTKQLLKQVFI